jgi:hypothetical protein
MRFTVLAAAISGCTLVVGGDPQLDHDAGVDASEDAEIQKDVAAPPPPHEDAGQNDGAVTPKCDASGCNATKDACKKTCASAAKACNDACTDSDGKSCHDLCAVKQASCNIACVQACDQCVMGCGPPCAN